jgi:starch synthase
VTVAESAPSIAFVTSELAPWAKVGGLGDVSASLPPALAAAGHDVRIFLPFYGRIRADSIAAVPIESAQQVGMHIAGRFVSFNLFEHRPGGEPASPRMYLVQCAPFFERGDEVYTLHDDEHVRWVFFCRAVLESCQRLQWGPDVLHVHDWPTALMPLFVRTLYAWDKLFARTRTVLTIHNLGYQGVFGSQVLGELGLLPLAPHFDPVKLANGQVNFLETGLRTADRLTTVSPTYAREIQTPEQGHGLDALLRARSVDLTGILNGIDADVWSPQSDRALPIRYGANSVWRRERNKLELLARVGLPEDLRTPLLGIIARLTSQKGFDLLPEVLDSVFDARAVRLVVLGSGEAKYEAYFETLQETYPSRVAFTRGYDEPLSHLIEAGVDLFLMPSHYEPCGLNQMYSQAYGAIPLVHRTGGLADTVEPFAENPDRGTGFLFEPYAAVALHAALERALDLYDQPERWQALRRRAMQREWTWGSRAEQYTDMYRALVEVA